eukprot:5424698-Prymnesium_polylepis.1
MKALIVAQRNLSKPSVVEIDEFTGEVKNPGLLSRLKAKVQENFRPRVVFKNIHVRYEQFAEGQGHAEVGSRPSRFAIGGAAVSQIDAFAAGFVLSELTLQRDDGGDDDTSTSRITFNLDSAGFYCDAAEEGGSPLATVGYEKGYSSTDHHFFTEQEMLEQEMKKECQRVLELAHAQRASLSKAAGRRSSPPTGWLFGPVAFSGEVNKAVFDRNKFDRPESHTIVIMPPVGLTLTNAQLSALMAFHGRMLGHQLLHCYLPHRPEGRPKAGSTAKHFWQSAVRAVTTVTSKRGENPHLSLMQVMALKKKYVELHLKMYAVAPADETDDLEELHSARQYLSDEDAAELQRIDDLIAPSLAGYWRVLSSVQHAQEMARKAKEEHEQKSGVFQMISSIGNSMGKKKNNLGLSESEAQRLEKEMGAESSQPKRKGRRGSAELKFAPGHYVHRK